MAWIVALGAVVIVAVVVIVVVVSVAGRDESSYKAGLAAGASWARDTVAVAGAGGVPDAEIVGTCPGLASFAENAQTYYYSDGQIAGPKIHHADFVKGCVDGARSVISR
jgi:hypothetical protein